MRSKEDGKVDVGVPTRTAPTNGWSRTHRTAMFAMLAPPWRSPILRNTVRSRWKRAQSPHTLVIASRYCAPKKKNNTKLGQQISGRKHAIKEVTAWGWGVVGGDESKGEGGSLMRA